MPLLTKLPIFQHIPFVPGIPAQPAFGMKVFATPTPQGFWYDPTIDGPYGLRPRTPFMVSLGGRTAKEAWWGPIYAPGYTMEFIRFPDVPVSPNGFPVGAYGPIRGVFTIPTVHGPLDVERTYYHNGHQGCWIPAYGVPNPPNTLMSWGNICCVMGPFVGTAGVPSSGGYDTQDPNRGWNAGANSIQRLDGDVRTVFQAQIASQIVIGFARERDDVTRYDNITHGVYLRIVNMGRQWAIIENGLLKTDFADFLSAYDVFKIERVSGEVRYYINNELAYASQAMSQGSLIVGAALYQAGDGIP